MSRHHHHPQVSNEKSEPQESEAALNPGAPALEKNDLMYLSIIKPFLSPAGQKFIQDGLNSGEAEPKNIPFDLPGLIAQLNLNSENNPMKELIPVLLNGMSGENTGALNPALLTTLMTMLNNKPENKQDKQAKQEQQENQENKQEN